MEAIRNNLRIIGKKFSDLVDYIILDDSSARK